MHTYAHAHLPIYVNRYMCIHMYECMDVWNICMYALTYTYMST